MKVKGFTPKLVLICLLVMCIIAYGVYTFSKSKYKKTANNKISSVAQPTISRSRWEDRDVPNFIVLELPAKSPDGKEKRQVYISSNDNYVIYTTFVKERGAGQQFDYWLFNRKTKQNISVTKSILEDPNFKKIVPTEEDIFLVFYDRWQGDNPAFSIANGWEIISQFWVFDILNNRVTYVPDSGN